LEQTRERPYALETKAIRLAGRLLDLIFEDTGRKESGEECAREMLMSGKALAKMREIGAQLREKYRIHRVAMVHRLGRLEIGETSVFIAVSAPHRAAAFDACRFAIDTLKRTVPIWKKEYFEDGAVWADGELPPAPLATPRAKPAS
jgi:molybdopterin synthase catalytic subunit